MPNIYPGDYAIKAQKITGGTPVAHTHSSLSDDKFPLKEHEDEGGGKYQDFEYSYISK